MMYKVLYLGARLESGLWLSTDAGLTESRVTSFKAYENPADATGYNNEPFGMQWNTFHTTGPKTAAGTSRIFVAVAEVSQDNISVSEDAGATWEAVPGQQTTFYL
jgi:xyloglucan-specific exo-beta-1,4-glucanase